MSVTISVRQRAFAAIKGSVFLVHPICMRKNGCRECFSVSSATMLRKLPRATMEQLLIACHKEGRAPTTDELHPPEPKRMRASDPAERTDTGRFDTIDDDCLVEILRRVPIKSRILFVRNLCKQFDEFARERKFCASLRIATEEKHNTLRTVGNWRFLSGCQIESLSIRECRSFYANVPPKEYMQLLTSLQLRLTGANTVKRVTQSIDPSKLTSLEVNDVKAMKAVTALLQQACHLKRLTLVCVGALDFTTIIDAWRGKHDALRHLSVIGGIKMTMRDLERLDLEELKVSVDSCKNISSGFLPSMRTLTFCINTYVSKRGANPRFHVRTPDAINMQLPCMKKLIASSPALETVALARGSGYRPEVKAAIAAALKEAFPRITVK
eukprot:7380208-Prymnesium_polylepis.1